MKRLLALLLAASMLICAGCGGGDKKDKTPSKPVETNGELELAEIELEDKTVTIMQQGELSEQQQNILSFAKQQYGIEVELIASGTGAEPMRKLVQLVSSGEAPDLFAFDNSYYPVGVIEGLFQNVNDFVDWNDVKFAPYKDSSANYDYYVLAGSEPRYVLWYNKTIFENAGIKTPLHYLQNDEWTWDKMFELSKQLTVATGSGTTQYGFADASGGMFYSRLAATGQDMVNVDKDGKYTSNLSNPVFEKIANVYRELATDGYMYYKNDSYEMFKSGKIAMFNGGKWLAETYGMKDMVSEGKISFVPTPRDSDADKYYYLSNGNGWVIPVNAKNPEGVKAWLQAMYYYYYLKNNDETYMENDRNIKVSQSGWTDLEFQMEEYIETETEHVILMYQGIGGVDGWLSYVWEMQSQLLDQQQPWATVRDRYEPLLKAEIKKIEK